MDATVELAKEDAGDNGVAVEALRGVDLAGRWPWSGRRAAARTSWLQWTRPASSRAAAWPTYSAKPSALRSSQTFNLLPSLDAPRRSVEMAMRLARIVSGPRPPGGVDWADRRYPAVHEWRSARALP